MGSFKPELAAEMAKYVNVELVWDWEFKDPEECGCVPPRVCIDGRSVDVNPGREFKACPDLKVSQVCVCVIILGGIL